MKQLGLGIIVAIGLTLPVFGQSIMLEKTYYITPLENDATRVVRLRAFTFPPKADSSFHRHPGDQSNTIDDGEITYTIKGQEPRTFKVGETAYIPRGNVHRSQNLTDKPARVIELNIIDKDKPDIELVTETLPAAGQGGVDPLIGTWKLNAAKSTGSAYRSLTLTFTAGDGHNLIANGDGVDNQGKQVHLVFLHTYDGMPHPTTGDPAVSDSSAYTRLGNTINIVRFRQGKLVDVSQSVIDTANKTYTNSGEALTANGQLAPYILIYDRQ